IGMFPAAPPSRLVAAAGKIVELDTDVILPSTPTLNLGAMVAEPNVPAAITAAGMAVKFVPSSVGEDGMSITILLPVLVSVISLAVPVSVPVLGITPVPLPVIIPLAPMAGRAPTAEVPLP